MNAQSPKQIREILDRIYGADSRRILATLIRLLGGYWMIQVSSREEAIKWARRCPAQDGDTIEVRQVFETSDFPPDVQEAADNPTVQAQVERHT